MTAPPSRDREPGSRDRVRRAGLRATRGRVAVLEHLFAAGAPRSHAELVDELAPLRFDRASVYRNLVDLTHAGLVRRFDIGDHVWRFEAASEHAHFVCTSCGDVLCLPAVRIVADGAAEAPQAVADQRVEVQLRGRCDRCDR